VEFGLREKNIHSAVEVAKNVANTILLLDPLWLVNRRKKIIKNKFTSWRKWSSLNRPAFINNRFTFK
jgi:hypothetical protein